MVAVYVPTLFVLGIVVVIRLITGIPISFFTGDASVVAHAPLYAGFLSNVGILVWCSTAAICVFCAALLHQEIDSGRDLAQFFLFSGLITSILLVDDLYLLHSLIFPRYLHIPEKLVYLGYGVGLLLYLMRFRTVILKSEFPLLIFALGFFGLSIIIDIRPVDFYGQNLLEDGSKLLGIISWATYFINAGLSQLKPQ
jgi:hypothetical protein